VFVDDPNTDADALLKELLEIAQDGMKDGTVVAIGEIGLDYDRLEFCPADIQQQYLKRQLQIVALPTGLPLFLHNRSVGSDLYNILLDLGWKNGGVVHSFDDELELATKFIELGLFIGLNGCSLRTDESLENAKNLPLDRLLLETECVLPGCCSVLVDGVAVAAIDSGLHRIAQYCSFHLIFHLLAAPTAR